MNLWLDGRMERGDAEILPPPGVGKVLGEGEKEKLRWGTSTHVVRAHHVTMGGGMH